MSELDHLSSAALDEPLTVVLEEALNNLPTLYLSNWPVTVSLAFTSYRMTFPVEMGDVPPLVMISNGLADPLNATELVKGVGSGSRLAFDLDGAMTHFLDFENDEITGDILRT